MHALTYLCSRFALAFTLSMPVGMASVQDIMDRNEDPRTTTGLLNTLNKPNKHKKIALSLRTLQVFPHYQHFKLAACSCSLVSHPTRPLVAGSAGSRRSRAPQVLSLRTLHEL